ncbi:MAG: hypothetical protein II189_03680, partial [Lachnospiraceae bacterium]|nr:hypothetical protein [Lachnospiraceae bacterium]
MAYKAERYAKRHEGQEAYGGRRDRKPEPDEKVRRAAADKASDAEVTPSENETRIEGRNAVIEAFRSGRTVDRLYMLDGSQEGAMMTIRREAKKHGTAVKYVTRQRLDQISETGAHQGVVA